jgi:hypothetical protein
MSVFHRNRFECNRRAKAVLTADYSTYLKVPVR